MKTLNGKFYKLILANLRYIGLNTSVWFTLHKLRCQYKYIILYYFFFEADIVYLVRFIIYTLSK